MTIQYIYDDSGFLTGVYDGPGGHPNSTTIAPPPDDDGKVPQFISGQWVSGTSAPTEPLLPVLTPMTAYMAFTTAERVAIKSSQDPYVIEFWAMFQLAVQLDKPVDPNLVSVREALCYLAAPADPGPGAGILATPERVTQILNGIPQ